MPPDRTLLPCSLHPPRSQCCVPPCPPLQSPPSAALGMQQGLSAGLEELPPPLSPSLLPSLRLVACTCLSLQFFNRCVFRSGLFWLAGGPLLQGSTGSLPLQPAGWMLPFGTGTCWIEGVLVWERGDPSPLSRRFWGLRGLPVQVSAQCPSPCWVSRLLVCLWQLPPALSTAGALCRVRGPSRTEPGAVWLPQGSALGPAASCRLTQPCGADGHCPPGLLGHAPPSGAQGKDADPKKNKRWLKMRPFPQWLEAEGPGSQVFELCCPCARWEWA